MRRRMNIKKAKMIQAIGINVLLEVPEKEEKTEGGIILPDNLKDARQLFGTVAKIVNMGEIAFIDVYGNIPSEKPKIGDIVYINQHAGNDVRIKEKLYRMVSSDEIRGVVEVEE
jgi:chaperonin GroES